MMDENRAARKLVREIHGRVLAAKGEVTTQLSDLLVFIGYFGLCLYAGGIASIEAYNAEMKLAILSGDNAVATAHFFLAGLMGSLWAGLVLVVGIIAISYIYVLARFALQLWLGLSLVVGLFSTLMIICVALGSSYGTDHAQAAFNAADDSLPVIKVPDPEDRELSDGRYRLLHDSGTHLFIVRPTVGNGLGEIKSLLKRNLESYEIIIQ